MGGSHRPGQLNSSASSSKLADGCGLRWGLFFQFFMDLFLANVHHQIWMILVLWYGFVLCFLMMFTLWYGFFDCFFVFFMTWIFFDLIFEPNDRRFVPSFAFHLACCTNAQLLSCYGTDVAQLFGMCRPHGAKHVAFQACNTQSFVCRGVNA